MKIVVVVVVFATTRLSEHLSLEVYWGPNVCDIKDIYDTILMIIIIQGNLQLRPPLVSNNLSSFFQLQNGKVKGKVPGCIRAKWPIRPELIPVSVA